VVTFINPRFHLVKPSLYAVSLLSFLRPPVKTKIPTGGSALGASPPSPCCNLRLRMPETIAVRDAQPSLISPTMVVE
jgi:hypothetical protein